MARDTSGKFQPGNTAAKAKRGFKDRGRQLARMFTEDDIGTVYQVLMSKALQGDSAALSLIAKYVAPPPKPTFQTVQFQYDNSDPISGANSILLAASEGVLPADVARTLLEAVAATQRIKEVTDLEERLKQLEAEMEKSS